MNDVRLERATEADAAAVAALRVAAARQLGTRFGDGPWARASDTIGGVALEARGGTLWIARGEGAVIATLRLLDANPWVCNIGFFTAAKRPVYLTSMAVAPAQQGRGVGRACLAEVERIARRWGSDAVRLDSFDAPAGAVGFYEKCGYRPVRRGEYLGVKLVWLEKRLMPGYAEGAKVERREMSGKSAC